MSRSQHPKFILLLFRSRDFICDGNSNMIESTIFKMAALFGVFALMAGCAVEPASQSVLDAYRLIRSEGSAAQHELNPKLSYLRVQTDGREVFMALGYVDATPDGPVEVWYSAEADVLRLRDGRVVGAIMKTGTNWLSVSFSGLPCWEAVAHQAQFERIRDVSPGYRYGIHEKVLIRRIEPPTDTQLKNIPASSLTWFEEIVRGGAVDRPARYALGQGNAVIYAEQCLSSEYCFSWQHWPTSAKGLH